jgi:hypothetical protein
VRRGERDEKERSEYAAYKEALPQFMRGRWVDGNEGGWETLRSKEGSAGEAVKGGREGGREGGRKGEEAWLPGIYGSPAAGSQSLCYHLDSI